MIKIENYCKSGVTTPGIPRIFDDEVDGELRPCPLCGRIPKPMVRADFLDTRFNSGKRLRKVSQKPVSVKK